MRGIIWYDNNPDHGFYMLEQIKKFYNHFGIKSETKFYPQNNSLKNYSRTYFDNGDYWDVCIAENALKNGRCSFGIAESCIPEHIVSEILFPLINIKPQMPLLFFDYNQEERKNNGTVW